MRKKTRKKTKETFTKSIHSSGTSKALKDIDKALSNLRKKLRKI